MSENIKNTPNESDALRGHQVEESGLLVAEVRQSLASQRAALERAQQEYEENKKVVDNFIESLQGEDQKVRMREFEQLRRAHEQQIIENLQKIVAELDQLVKKFERVHKVHRSIDVQ